MSAESRPAAFDILALILDLRDRRAQDVRPVVQRMLGLDPEERLLLRDGQVLLGHEELPALRRVKDLPPPQADPDDAFPEEDVAPMLEALRLAETVRLLFPDLQAPRWQLARALLADEAAFQAPVAAALRTRGDEAARRSIEERIAGERPVWFDRAGTIRSACLGVLHGILPGEGDTAYAEAEELYELFAVCDRRAMNLLWALDTNPDEAARQVQRLHEIAHGARSPSEKFHSQLA